MKKLASVILLAGGVWSGAAVAQSQNQIANEINTLLAPNTRGAITAANIQQVLNDLNAGKASLANPTFTGTVTMPAVALTGTGSTGPADTFTVQAADGTSPALSQAFRQLRQVLTPKGSGMTTNPFSSDDPTPAVINRMADRLFLGGATVLDGKGTPVTKDWLETVIPNSTANGQLSSLATRGNSGLVGGSRTSDSPTTGGQGAWGLGGFVLNDNTANVQTGYGAYFEARRYAGAGIVQGWESNSLNGGTQVDVRPFLMGAPGLSAAGWLSSGRTDAPTFNNNSSAALGIVNNGSSFLRGIVFGQNSIAGVSNGTGTGEAITMASGHLITWYTPDNTAGPYIGSAMTSSGFKGSNLLWQDDGPHFRNSAGADMLLVYSPPAASNGFGIIASLAGSAPSLSARGSDANIDVNLAPKGTGRVTIAGAAKLPSYTVAGLPTASSCQDCLVAVTDATSPTYRGTLTGGGTVRTLAYSDGTSWTSH